MPATRSVIRARGNNVRNGLFTPATARSAVAIGRSAAGVIKRAWKSYKARKGVDKAIKARKKVKAWGNSAKQGAAFQQENIGQVTIYRGKQRKPKGTFQSKWDYQSTNTQRNTSVIGSQGVQTAPGTPMYGGDLSTIYTQVTGTFSNPSSLTSTKSAFNHLYVDSCVKTTTLINCSNFTCTIWIYTLVPRMNWAIGGATENAVTIAGQDTMLMQSGSTTPTIYEIGWTPYRSPSICKFFKIKKCNKYVINAGAKVIYTTKIFPKRAFRADQLVTFDNQQLQWLKNLTGQMLIVQQGEVLNDSGTLTQISLGASALDVVEVTKYEGYWAMENFRQSFNTTNLATAFTNHGEGQSQDFTSVQSNILS